MALNDLLSAANLIGQQQINPGIVPQSVPAATSAPMTASSLKQFASNPNLAPGVGIVLGAQQMNLENQAAAQQKQLVQQLAQQVQTKDYQGALATYSQLDPEGFKSLAPQLGNIDPQLARSLSASDAGGKLDEQTAIGANPRQLLEREIEAGKFAKDTSKEDRLGKQFNVSTIRQYQKDYNSHVKNVEEQINNLGGLDSFAELAVKNPLAAAQIGVKVSKAMGEVGALSESDVKRYVQNAAISDKVAAEVVKLSKGTLLPKNAKYLKESLQAIAAIAQDRQQFLQNKFTQQVANNLEIPIEEAQFKLGFIAERTGQKQSEKEKQEAEPVRKVDTKKYPVGSTIEGNKSGKRFMVGPDGSLSPITSVGATGKF